MNASDGVIVNLGAKWDPFARREASCNDDPAWMLALMSNSSWRIVGFEGSAEAHHRTRRALRYASVAFWAAARGASLSHLPTEPDPPDRVKALQARVTLLNEYVDADTICARLEAVGVSTRENGRFALLKVDIDSIDLPVTQALLRCGLRPRAIYVEVNPLVPLSVRFSAQPGRRRPGAPPTFGGAAMWGGALVWPCFGASLSAWDAMLARRFGYRLAGVSPFGARQKFALATRSRL